MSGKTRSPAIGIDLGTTYSCVAYWKHDRVEIITNDQGNRITPSYVAFTDSERLVGDAAFNQFARTDVNTIFDVKRLIGRKFSDKSVQSDIKLWPFKVTSGNDDMPVLYVTHKDERKEFVAEEISAMVLTKMKEIAEKYIGSIVTDAVVTVPAYFDLSQHQATVDAAKIAGLNVLNIIKEPIAAAIAYSFENSFRIKKKRNVLVFDLGGGTFDVTLLTMKRTNVEVKAIAGDTHLGGEDFNNRMVNHYIAEFKKEHNKDMHGNPRSLGRLRTACERAKRMLSSTGETRIDTDALFEGIDFSARITRPKFEELNLDLFNKCIEIVARCLTEAKMKKKDVDDIVLVGGSSRIPKVQQLLQKLLRVKKLRGSLNPDESVAYGVAIQAAKSSNQGNVEVHQYALVETTRIANTNGRLSENEIERMMEEAFKYMTEDEKRKKNNEARIAFEEFIREMRGDVQRKNYFKRKEVEDAIEKAFEWLEATKENVEVHEYKKKTKELHRSVRRCYMSPIVWSRTLIK